MPLYIEQSGDLVRCHGCLTDRLTDFTDSATHLLIMYKSGALVTQLITQKKNRDVKIAFENFIYGK